MPERTAAHLARKLLDLGERYRGLVASIDAGFCVIEMLFDAAGVPADYRFIEVNPAFEGQTGMKNAAGRRMREFAPDHEAHWFETYGRVALTGEAIRFENHAGSLGRWFEVYAYRVGEPKDRHVAVLFNDVSGRRHAEQALQASEARMRDLNADLERQVVERARDRGRTWEVSPDLLGVLNRKAMFESSNPAWQTVLGWSHEELSRTPLFDLVHPDDLEATYEGFAVLKRGEPVLRFENRYRMKGGGWRWLSWVAVPEDDKFYASARDITEQKEQGAQLAARTAERDRVWRNSRDILVVVDGEGIFRAVNPAWHTILGHAEDEVIGRSYLEFIWPDDAAASANALVAAIASHDLSNFENRFRHRDGTPRWFSWHTSHEGDLVYAYGRHVTEERQQAEALRQAEEQLRQSQKLEAVGQLTGGVAHDFNNLLTVIRGSVDLLRRPDLSEDRRKRYIDAISETAIRATNLTGQLLAFARRQALKPEVFDAGVALLALADMMRTLTGPHIHLETSLPDEPCFIDADPTQFDTSLINMAVNARDAMSAGGWLTLSVRAADVIPAMRAHPAVPGEYVAVSIADTGEGIAPEMMDKIFEPFFTTKGVGHGTGLGLSQVFGFAKQSGGEVQVESQPGVGTTFTLYLPRAPRPDAVARAAPGELPVDGDGACVLVVEDNVDVGAFATQTLGEMGYETVLAVDAREALAELAAGVARFDVVFTDVVMPGMNGIDLAKEIRRLYPRLPVVLTSGYSHVLAEHGSHGFELLQKPYSIDALSRVLRTAAATRRSP
ncbi:PAS domain S-box protein [Iodidimonas sp. SYSU 1G8]|uniref:PAS domain S-box protein n=1 Tax=Iodidimonas sp. SYSU 1G8 TaxID=3133967 RepID=UPI0031FE58AC